MLLARFSLPRRGYFSRAVASLGAAAVVSEPDAAQKDAMRALLPEPSVPTAILAPMKAVRKALHGFVLGSLAASCCAHFLQLGVVQNIFAGGTSWVPFPARAA
jgi:hypothetical protein